ncbi:MAG: SRPBCC family protein [Candidatus Kapaibacteriota bacterium]|jgi:hypothetical protein
MKVVILFVLVIIAFVFVAGILIPKQREFEKHAELNSPPEIVFQVVTDFANQTSWRDDVKEIKEIDGKTWTEVPKKGTPITFRIKRKVVNQLFEMEIIYPKSFKGYWIGTFEKTENGTKVIFKEVAIIENPFFRVLSLIFVDLDKTMDLYMYNLKTKLGK